jgi:hypothetical protein
MQHRIHALLLSVSLVAVVGCGKGEERAAEEPATSIPAHIWSDTPLAGAEDVKDARERRKDGDEVVLRGTLQDFGELATFKLVEDSLEDCIEKADGCETPWDYCCIESDTLARLTVNVEFLDGDLPASWSLRGAHGLDHLTEVTVAGKLRFDESGNMRLEATRLAKQ